MTGRAFAGKLALVTGASRGIGHAVALALAGAGAHVIAAGRTLGALEDLDDAIKAGGGQATLSPFDLRDPGAIERLAETIAARWGHLDILVANAGVLGQLSPLDHVSDKVWAEVLEVNVAANARLVRACAPLLKRAEAGRAIFLSSSKAKGDTAYWGPYAVSKAALEALALTFAAECAASAVRVNVVRPGPVATGMRLKAMPGEDRSTLRKPEDVAPLILPLVSVSEARNGAVISLLP